MRIGDMSTVGPGNFDNRYIRDRFKGPWVYLRKSETWVRPLDDLVVGFSYVALTLYDLDRMNRMS